MRSTLLFAIPVIAAACAPPDVAENKKPLIAARAKQSDALERADGDDDDAPRPGAESADGITAGTPSLDEPSAPELPDADRDGVPDSADCAPASPLEGARIIEDDLAAATGSIAAATGFDATSWTHALGGFTQSRVRDVGDLALFKVPLASDVVFDVVASSTATAKIRPRLRQVLVTVGVGVSVSGGIDAFGCGVEDVEGESAKMLASVVRLGGPAGAMTVTKLKRAALTPIGPNVTFGVKARVANGSITCTIDGTTTVVAENVGAVRGMAGIFTRQTSATFRKARICAVPGATP